MFRMLYIMFVKDRTIVQMVNLRKGKQIDGCQAITGY